MDMRIELRTIRVFDTETIANGSSSTSQGIDLYGVRNWGLFSMQVKNSGDGSLQLQYESSNDNVPWVTPTIATAICTSFTKTSGPGSGSTDMFTFSPVFGRYIRFKATASGGASVILLATLAIQ